MTRGRLSVTIVYTYETDTEFYPEGDRSAMGMARSDIEDSPTVVLDAGDWVVKDATFEESLPDDSGLPHPADLPLNSLDRLKWIK